MIGKVLEMGWLRIFRDEEGWKYLRGLTKPVESELLEPRQVHTTEAVVHPDTVPMDPAIEALETEAK